MKINILYEDANILAIEKPAGLAVHSDGRTREKTLADWILKNYPKMKDVGEPEGGTVRPGIVHRLDRDTSGVLLLAKNQKAHAFLKQQFSIPALELASDELANRQERVKKTYVAIVNGWIKNDRGIINKPIGRSPADFRKYSAGRGARGEMREAVTQYRVLKRFEEASGHKITSRLTLRGFDTKKKINDLSLNKYTYIEVRPKTGRTHQIRVHMKYLQHPIVGDTLYNPDGAYPKGFSRMALHAKSIEFKNLKGETVKVESKVPKEFEEVITNN